ncbi:MAG: NAD(+) diphosphatase [Marinilabiliales bacterium]|nr:MAG: NAD(+) diphosphatase [Marinilabiliales bacterium]
MIQDIYPHRFSNDYIGNRKMDKDDIILYYKYDSFLLKSCGDKFSLPQKRDFPEISDKTRSTFLFSLNDISCYLVWDDLSTDQPEFIYKEINFFRHTNQQEIAWASMVGYHLMNWYAQNRFCGKCGAETEEKQDERALVCTTCSSIIYPRISPAVIAAIICKDKILLARGANWPGDWYSCIAGYVDVGESIEEALQREAKEEVGLDIKNIRYYKSQPWPLSGSMMIGFVAEADDRQRIVVEEKEIAEAKWFHRSELPKYSSKISIAGEMIEKFQKGAL